MPNCGSPMWLASVLLIILVFCNLVSGDDLLDCKEDRQGLDYQGTVSVTDAGLECQAWTDQSPQAHTRGEFGVYAPYWHDLDGSADAAANYCRNPDSEPNGVWCYTTDPLSRWEYCDVPECGENEDTGSECKQDLLGKSYKGKIAVTKSGKTCQAWTSQSPHSHIRGEFGTYASYWHDLDGSAEAASNHCRNPDSEPNGVWCYTKDVFVRWQYCDVPRCDGKEDHKDVGLQAPMLVSSGSNECKTEVKGMSYQGKVAVTRTGKTCQAWSSQYPHYHTRGDLGVYRSYWHSLDGSAAAASNYCRNPDSEAGPWCYTTDVWRRWEQCEIPECGACPAGFEHIEDAGCYLLGGKANVGMSWVEAESWCGAHAGRLATIQSQTQQDNLAKFATDSGSGDHLWIGLANTAEADGVRSWVDGSAETFTMWDTKNDEPDRSGDCIFMAANYQYEWHVSGCSKQTKGSDIPIRPLCEPSGVQMGSRVAGYDDSSLHKYNWITAVVDKSSEYNTDIWSAGQIIGEPNVYPNYGDLAGAWAHLRSGSGPTEFIEVQIENPIIVTGINVYETNAGGGITSIDLKKPDGEWQSVWSGDASGPITTARIWNPELFETSFATKDIRLRFDCTGFGTWCEIDAVNVLGAAQQQTAENEP